MATRPDTLASALEVLNDMADQPVLDRVESLLKGRVAFWTPDPEVPMVWGLVHADSPRKAFLVVYLRDRGDFEFDMDVFL